MNCTKKKYGMICHDFVYFPCLFLGYFLLSVKEHLVKDDKSDENCIKCFVVNCILLYS